jgi:hypothetical protein
VNNFKPFSGGKNNNSNNTSPPLSSASSSTHETNPNKKTHPNNNNNETNNLNGSVLYRTHLNPIYSINKPNLNSSYLNSNTYECKKDEALNFTQNQNQNYTPMSYKRNTNDILGNYETRRYSTIVNNINNNNNNNINFALTNCATNNNHRTYSSNNNLSTFNYNNNLGNLNSENLNRDYTNNNYSQSPNGRNGKLELFSNIFCFFIILDYYELDY